MEDFKYLCEYFEEYKWSSSEKTKKKIEDSFLTLVFEKDGFKFERNKKIIFGDLYEKDFNITHEQKKLFIKYCIHKMFENYLTEEEYKNLAIQKKLKRSYEIRDKDLYDSATFDDDIEEYFARTFYFKLKNNAWKFHDATYFQCPECGGLFKKSKNNRQKYCSDCRIIVSRRQFRARSKKYYHAIKNRK